MLMNFLFVILKKHDMQRTYKSKRDGSGLDHREMVCNVDEKNSVFDAFYIQNIKQTKREQSCTSSMNHYGVSRNKVRKRKYVKKAAKETDPPLRESLTNSVFLTPDKSLRVNKAQDLFDQLLNSSPGWSGPKKSKEDIVDQIITEKPKEAKTYRIKRDNVKKYNDSSSESSESDKENFKRNYNNSVQNETDIRSHVLIIEKEAVPAPEVDESINHIVKKLTQLNQYKKSTLGSCRNRLTLNFPSPSQKTSPLSSTPYTEKQRSQSIYRFSPIPMGDLEDSPKYVTIVEDDNDSNKSIVFVPKNTSNALKRSKNEDNIVIPTFYANSKTKENSEPLFSSEANTLDNLANRCKSESNIDKNESSKLTLQTSEMEPFVGFTNEVVEKIDVPIIIEDINDSFIMSTGESSKSKQISQKSLKSSSQDIVNNDDSLVQKDNKNNTNISMTAIERSVSVQPFLGFPAEDNDLVVDMSTNDTTQNKSGVEISKVENEIDIDSDDVSDDENSFSTNSHSSKIENSNNSSTAITTEDNGETFYDTCSSAASMTDENVDRIPVVRLERMKMSSFNKYYNKMADYESDTEDSYQHKSLSDDYASFVTGYDSGEVNDDENSQSTNAEIELTSTETDAENKDSDQSTDDERCFSYVTTRRRHDNTNITTVLVLDDSQDSNTSRDDNKTVLSYKHSPKQGVNSEMVVESDAVNIEINNGTLISENFNDEEPACNANSVESDTRLSLGTIRKSNMPMPRERLNTSPNVSMASELKTGIVLQPGKKWERSLSIYRRMTTMSDYFDQSMLDEEDLHRKGRKYRQSVINTMEMQECRGLLHNESINSRRSTFIPKPSRSTIRIVKETGNSRISLSSTTVFDDLKGFLEDCDDTIVELSKLSIADDLDVTVLDKFNESRAHDSRIATARDYVLRRCNQIDTLPFDECYPDSALKNCRKIGEGVYGEVYLWRAPDGRARVMKIVPIAGDIKVNGEQQKDFHEIISEIVIAMELSALRAPISEVECHLNEGKEIDAIDLHSVENATDVFNEVLGVKCVYGSYPSRLLDLWELYDESRGSENDSPAALPPHQQYIVLELANAGQDLESFTFASAEQAYALFWQVAFALAVGEEAFQFEHRDLHWGNVLIAPTDQKFATFVLRGRCHQVARRGVAATIIDYSLSRVSLPLPRCERDRDTAALYNDLAADEGLFAAVGDYQFQVYRLMRDKLGNDWKNFEPYTNILWLHYIVDKMITALRYKRTTTKIHKQYIGKLKAIRDRLLGFGSAVQFVLTHNEL